MEKYWNVQLNADNTAEILVYGTIGASFWDEDSVTAKQVVRDIAALNGRRALTVRISSPGGNVFEGIAIYNALKAFGGTVTTQVDSLAASMASVIFMAGSVRRVAPMTSVMIHNPRALTSGEAKDMRKAADLLDMVKGQVIAAYAEGTGQTAETLSAWMDAETWFTPEAAIAAGFATEMAAEAPEITATFEGEFFSELTAGFKFPEHVRMMAKTKVIKQPPGDEVMADQKIEPVAPVAAVTVDGAAMEFDRTRAICNAFTPFAEHSALMVACLSDRNCSAETARDKLLVALGRATAPVTTPRVEVGRSASDKFMEGAGLALEMRGGIVPHVESPNEFRSMSLMDMARHSLRMSGQNPDRMDRYGIAHAVLASSSDFPKLFANVAGKAMMKGYSTTPETYSAWTQKGTMPDFKSADRVGMSEFSTIERVYEGGEYKRGKFSERREQIQLLKYGKEFRMTFEMIINDDLGMFLKASQSMGSGVRRKVGDLAYSVLTANAAMGQDGVALFHASHGNLAGAGTAVSVASISAGKASMAVQKDLNDTTAVLNIDPAFMVVPVALYDLAQTVISAETDFSSTNSKKPNIHRNSLTVIKDARLDTASATAWYLVGGQAYDTVEMAFLDGREEPILEQLPAVDTDGVQYRVTMIAAAKAIDWKAMYKNVGA